MSPVWKASLRSLASLDGEEGLAKSNDKTENHPLRRDARDIARMSNISRVSVKERKRMNLILTPEKEDCRPESAFGRSKKGHWGNRRLNQRSS